MKYLKELFMCSSDDLKYKNTILVYIAANIVIALITILSDIVFENAYLLRFIIAALFVYFLMTFSIRLTAISDNRSAQKIKNGKYTFKFKPILVNVDDIIIWLKHMEEPETIICSYINEFYIIEIAFDLTGIRGDYYNKQLYFNNSIISESDLIKKLREKNQDGKITVYETFDKNKPEILIDEIDEIKAKLKEH